MADVLKQAFTDVADAIREHGITGTMTPLQMPTKVSQIQTTKYGVSIYDLFGGTDANGKYVAPSTSFSFQSSDIVSIGERGLQYMFKYSGITSLSIPNLTTVGYGGMWGACYYATNLASVNISNLATIGEGGLASAFSGTSLEELDLSNLVNDSSNGLYGMCRDCTSLKKVYLTKFSVSGSASLAFTFNGCTSLELVDFSQATAVPTMANNNCFGDPNEALQIVVPDALYSNWIAAPYWAAFKSHIISKSDYDAL